MDNIYAWAAGNSAVLIAFGLWLLGLQKQANAAETLAKNVKEEQSTADSNTKEVLKEIKQAMADLHNQLTALTGTFALFRETTARDVVSHATLKEVEERFENVTRMKFDHLVKQNEDLRASVEALNTRFDNFLASMISPVRRRASAR